MRFESTFNGICVFNGDEMLAFNMMARGIGRGGVMGCQTQNTLSAEAQSHLHF